MASPISPYTPAHPPEVEIILDNATEIIAAIEYAIQANDPDNNLFFPADAPPPITSLTECEFPDCIDDPLEIVRRVLGDAHADRIAYEDDAEIILAEIEFCRHKLLRGSRRADEAPEGDTQGEEQNHGQIC
jgi:hypothetical protein